MYLEVFISSTMVTQIYKNCVRNLGSLPPLLQTISGLKHQNFDSISDNFAT